MARVAPRPALLALLALLACFVHAVVAVEIISDQDELDAIIEEARSHRPRRRPRVDRSMDEFPSHLSIARDLDSI